jgi:phosphatidate cytidylyltransferase
LLILLVLKGTSAQFGYFVIILTFLGLGEFFRMAVPERRVLGFAASVAGALLPVTALFTECVPLVPVMTLQAISFALYFLFTFEDLKEATREMSILCLGLMYVPLLIVHLQLLRQLPHGQEWMFLLMVIVMTGDSGAFYVGSTLGKHRLCPLVSPKKSVEGAVGGLAGSVIGAIVAKYTFFPQLTIVDACVTALFIGTLGQLGDLFESFLKRSFGVKDSGAIFPGHGGVLDRLDSILFAAPAAFYYASYLFPCK